MKLSRIIAILLFAAAAASLSALDLKEGKMKLVLSETTGRFSLFSLTDSAKGEYVPLFFSDDPRTSGLTIAEGDQLYRMGDTSAFTQKIEHDGSNASFVWTSRTLTVTQAFRFTRSPDSSAANGVVITVTVQNTGNRATKVGARYLIDTTLGEHSAAHFRSAEEGAITHETALDPSARDPYVISESSGNAPLGLEIMLFGTDITTPTSVALANWKRLNEAPWDFQVNTSRNFNLMPYSINDSAVQLNYELQTLNPGATRKIVTVMGDKNPSGFTGESVSMTSGVPSAASAAAAPPAAAAPQQPAAPGNNSLAQPGNNVINNGQTNATDAQHGALEEDYLKASELVKKLNELISAPAGTIDEAQLKSIQDQLSALEARKSQYTTQ